MGKSSEAELLTDKQISEAAQLVMKAEDDIRERRKIKSPQEITNVIRVEQKGMRVPLLKITGHTMGAKEERSKYYFSRAKGLSFYLKESELLQFQNNAFYTDDPEFIELLDTHPLKGVEYWPNALPDYIVEQRQRDKQLLTYDSKLYG